MYTLSDTHIHAKQLLIYHISVFCIPTKPLCARMKYELCTLNGEYTHYCINYKLMAVTPQT